MHSFLVGRVVLIRGIRVVLKQSYQNSRAILNGREELNLIPEV